MSTYFTLPTAIGRAMISNAIAQSQQVDLTHMAIGDGNGQPVIPNEQMVELPGEKYRAPISDTQVNPDDPTQFYVDLVVPQSVGGWVGNCVGVYASNGALFAVANIPAAPKPIISEGAGRELTVRIYLAVENASVVNIVVNPTMVLATRDWAQREFWKKTDLVKQTDPYDPTPGRLMGVGAHGLGTEFKVLSTANKLDHTRFVIGLVDVTNVPNDVFSQFSGKIEIMRSNGVEPPIVLDVVIQKIYNQASATANISIRDNLTFQDISGIKGCLFTYNGKRYAGIDVYVSATAKDFVLISGLFAGRTVPFIIEYRNVSTSQILNAEVNASIQYSMPGYCGRAYTQANIVGPVGQLNGVPTGAMIQRAANVNGQYTRWADGSMEAYTLYPAGAGPTIQEGSIYRSNSYSWTFPNAFSDVPAAGWAESGGIGYCWCSLGSSATSSTSTSFAIWRYSPVGAGVLIALRAFGRWFN
ncbi:phage tail protein [uncultured Rheinheimera sp.]|uniref:phage tail protein n=1 Tax=uncultured Rheinheimera sp. TaxID=400532 RepID=UPI00259A9254|nr:phage tail protein [uncultured Rheinheimera sp.]